MLKDELSWLLRRSILLWLFCGALVSFLLVWAFTSPMFIQPAYRSQALIFVPLTLFTQQFEQHGIGFASDAEIDGHIQILRKSLEVTLPEAYVISPAVSAYKSSWPPRLLLSLSAAVIYMVIFLFVEMIRKDVRAPQ